MIEELDIPTAPDAAGWDDFVAMTAVLNACEAASLGTHENDVAPEDLLATWLDTRFDPKRLFVARVDGAIVARAGYETQTDPASTHAWFSVQVLPAFRRRGIGMALADRVEALAESEGRAVWVVYAPSPDDAGGPGDRLPAPTGYGSVPAANPEVRFLLGRGYRLEQIERASRLALPLAPDALRPLQEWEEAGASGYRLHSWTGATPDAWVDDLAVLLTRMSTDAPSAGLEEPEDVWTAERVLAQDAKRKQSVSQSLTTVAEHIESGTLCGFSVLLVPPDIGRAVAQHDTLVVREHRGHALGLMLKLGNLRFLENTHPGHPAVTTYNAEENRPMLDVNERIGFVPIGYEGAWRKDVP